LVGESLILDVEIIQKVIAFTDFILYLSIEEQLDMMNPVRRAFAEDTIPEGLPIRRNVDFERTLIDGDQASASCLVDLMFTEFVEPDQLSERPVGEL